MCKVRGEGKNRSETRHTFLGIIGASPTDYTKRCAMDSTTIPFTIQLPSEMPFAFSLQALAERLQTLTDRRKARGIRYPLDVLLLTAVLAKLSGHSRLEALAE